MPTEYYIKEKKETPKVQMFKFLYDKLWKVIVNIVTIVAFVVIIIVSTINSNFIAAVLALILLGYHTIFYILYDLNKSVDRAMDILHEVIKEVKDTLNTKQS